MYIYIYILIQITNMRLKNDFLMVIERIELIEPCT